MYICHECGAHLDKPHEPHKCDQPPKVKRRREKVTDDLPKSQVPYSVQKARTEQAWKEWDAC